MLPVSFAEVEGLVPVDGGGTVGKVPFVLVGKGGVEVRFVNGGEMLDNATGFGTPVIDKEDQNPVVETSGAVPGFVLN